MSPLIQSLRVNCDEERQRGYFIEGPFISRHPNMAKVTLAVEEYLALEPKYRGCLSRIAEKHKTTPGTILCRIRRGQK